VRPSDEGGNVLIDSPRFASQLVRQIASMGGVSRMLLTHKDDIAAHDSFHQRFGTLRTMHRDDGAVRLGIENVIEGEAPVPLDADLLAIPTPGHTRGHVVFLYKQKFLFTGDHLAWSPTRQTLTAFRSVAWYSWPEQIRSMEKLLAYDFQYVLPGHGEMHHDSEPNMRKHLERCVAWMKTR
jgi:glyoxylase-like metal-dependent hydrolase (beta-lactamase superfamily II)